MKELFSSNCLRKELEMINLKSGPIDNWTLNLVGLGACLFALPVGRLSQMANTRLSIPVCLSTMRDRKILNDQKSMDNTQFSEKEPIDNWICLENHWDETIYLFFASCSSTFPSFWVFWQCRWRLRSFWLSQVLFLSKENGEKAVFGLGYFCSGFSPIGLSPIKQC